MKRIALAGLALCLAFVISPSAADAQSACDFYRVKKGDSLRDITQRAYGDDQYRRVWRANQTEVGRDPNILSIGVVLKLPCLDGSLPVGPASPSFAEADADTISFVTANGYLPYTGEALDQGGILTHLVQTAMLRAAPETPVEIVFVNDWAAHLETLLPRQAFDASFPWTMPGCETQGALTTVELYACQKFVYSDPFYDVVDGFIARAGDDLRAVIDPVGLQGTKICRPEGYPTSHLEQMGLMPPMSELVQPTTAHDCFGLLMSGQVDLVSLDTRAAERVVMDMGLDNQVIENPHIYSIEQLRVALHKDNPKSAVIIDDLNTGLGIMLQSGEWASIVSDGLKEQPTELVN